MVNMENGFIKTKDVPNLKALFIMMTPLLYSSLVIIIYSLNSKIFKIEKAVVLPFHYLVFAPVYLYILIIKLCLKIIINPKLEVVESLIY